MLKACRYKRSDKTNCPPRAVMALDNCPLPNEGNGSGYLGHFLKNIISQRLQLHPQASSLELVFIHLKKTFLHYYSDLSVNT